MRKDIHPDIFEKLESNDRFYCRDYPVVFHKASGPILESVSGKQYIDFFCGAGALNYGHNPVACKEAVISYLQEDGIIQGLDMATAAKHDFLADFQRIILEPRQMSYKVQFCGPTGTNAVEAALKLARKVTGRSHVITFTNGFHGMTLGALALTGSRFYRRGAGLPLAHTVFMPYDRYFGDQIDTLAYIARYLADPSSGLEPPAAFIVEVIQGEGGLNAASQRWLEGLHQLARAHGSLLIIDDIQAGCGRTGSFFSFEAYDMKPDLICLSKSLSGCGFPLSALLIAPEHDIWKPGEHSGTFRGFNLAFVAARAALRCWEDPAFLTDVRKNTTVLDERLNKIVAAHPQQLYLKGRGMMQGIAFREAKLAHAIVPAAFHKGLLVETAGPHDEVIKLFPPLTVGEAELRRGLALLEEAIEEVCLAGGKS